MFVRERAAGLWILGSVVDPLEFEHIDRDKALALDGGAGGSYSMSSALVLGGAGVDLAGANHVISGTVTIESLALLGSGDLMADTVQGKMLAVSIAASGDVKINKLDVDVLGVSIAGSGDFAAAGRAAEQGFSIAGSGDINAADLVGQTVKVRIAGSGDVRVHAEQLLDVSVAGSGDVIYRGAPVLRKSIAGSGDVRRAK